jgi:uncharacterized protein with HEPN domain
VRSISERLRDIQEAITRIIKYTKDGRDRFDQDELIQSWVTQNIYVIGEATSAIANEFPDFKRQHPEIKWTEIIGMRTILAHRYFDTDLEALWVMANSDLYDLKISNDAILAEEERQQEE